MSRNEGTKSTILVLLLLANLAFLAYIVVRTRQNRQVTVDLGAAMADLQREIDVRDREIHERIRERTQAGLERDAWRGKAEEFEAENLRLVGALEEIDVRLASVRAERDEHLDARLAAERRVEDAFTSLTGLEALKSRIRELEAVLAEGETAGRAHRAERAEWLETRKRLAAAIADHEVSLKATADRLNSLIVEHEAVVASRAALRQRLLDLSRLALSLRQGE